MNDNEKFEMFKMHAREARRCALELGATATDFCIQFDAKTMSSAINTIDRQESFECKQLWPDRIDHVTSGRIEDETIVVIVTERTTEAAQSQEVSI